MHSHSSIGALALLAFASSWAVAADAVLKAPASLPAVSAPNSKLEALGGSLNDQSFGAIAGSFTVPIDRRYGFQLDALAGSWAGSAVYGVGAHWFWRDPSIALFGFYADYVKSDRQSARDVARFAGEFEIYRGNFTLEGLLGVERGSVQHRFFDKIDLAFYLNPNLRASIGHRYFGGRHALALGGEWAPMPSAPYSLFVEGRAGEDNLKSLVAGVRGYFGPAKSLMRRHREDDPGNQLTSGIESLGGSNGGAGIAFCPDGTTPLPPGGLGFCPM